MPFDSNGVFSRVMNWTSDQQNGIAIECGRHDAEDNNFAEGFNETFCRDGRAAATGNFNLGNHKIQNLADGIAATDAVTKGQLDASSAAGVSLNTDQTITGAKTFTVSPNVPTPATSDNSTKVATTAYVKNQGYALDNAVVHLTDTETITGSKTFNTQPQFASGQGIRFNTSSNDEYYVMRSSGSPALGCSFLLNNSTTASAFNISSTKIIIGSNTILPNTITPATSDNSTRIATTAYVKNQGYAIDTDVMKTTGNQTIGGTKTFSSNPAIQNTAPALYLNSMDIIKGTAPSETQYAGITFRDSTGDIKGSLARILTGYQTNKESFISLYAFKSDATPATEAGLIGDSVTMHYPATGNPYATAPASDVVNSIVTTVNKSKAANGYFQLGNGLIIQWGKSTATSSSGSVTLPKAFSSTNYAVVINDVMANIPSSQASNAIVVGWGVVQSRSTTAFTAFLCNYENSYWWAYKESGRTFTWIAIGY